MPFVSRLTEPSFWALALQVAGVNFLLSGDNVVAITLAARALPARRRRWGVALGVVVAILLTIFFIAIVSVLMRMPFLRIAAGAALLQIAFHLGLSEPVDDRRIFMGDGVIRTARAIAVATLVMSLDNVIAIAAVARDDLAAMVLGLVVSIPFVVMGAAAIGGMFDRFRGLVPLGAGLLGWIAGETIAADPALTQLVEAKLGSAAAPGVGFTIATAGAVSVLFARWPSIVKER
jgi:YjbE family integral membrane protein